MTQEITYGGCSATPSDYTSPDGDFSVSIGLVPEDGALRPVPPPRSVFSAGEGCSVVYVHETNAFRHYIISDTSGNLYWVDADGETSVRTPLVSLGRYVELYQVNAVGNTLILLTEEGMRYLLWKSESKGFYKDLGNGLPEIPISFGLRHSLRWYGSTTVQLPNGIRPQLGITIEDRKALTDQILGIVNEAVASNHKEGYFIYPFFVRYAVRLFDGSLTMHSPPVLMVCATGAAPIVTASIPDSGTSFPAQACTVSHWLDYAVVASMWNKTPEETKERILEYKDIISSVDIFISAPIYTYKQDSSDLCSLGGTPGKGVFTLSGGYATYPDYKWKEHSEIVGSGIRSVRLPSKDEEEITKEICSCSNFYLLKSIPLNELAVKRTVINVPENYLTSLVTRELMTDDYDSHDLLIPRMSYTYNGRLNLTDVGKQYFGGFDPSATFCCSDYSHNEYESSSEETVANAYANSYGVYYCLFFIRDPNVGEISTKSQHGVMRIIKGNPLLYLYYPNIYAYKAIIYLEIETSRWRRVEIELKRHDFLNGVYYFSGWEGIDLEKGDVVGSRIVPQPVTIELKAKIYTSEVNNPFYFPVEGINTVGTGRVLGISSATKALSQGQFGQFPLYAFTTDGVWALEVSSTGTYSARQPVTRDVCIDPASITQLDDSVLFATDRGIMLISGSETVCITDTINPDGNPFALSSLPRADALLGRYNKSLSDDTEAISTGDLSLPSFASFIKGCRMVYDYVNQRIITYNPDVRFAYVYSLKSRTWGMMLSRIASNVNSYPEALAMDFDGNLVDFSTSDAAAVPVFAVTRPFKLGDPDVLKTIDTVIQRGCLTARDHVAQVLYGSRDMVNWHIIWSSTDIYLRGFRGSPYKYFRLMLIGRLSDGESLHGCTVQFTPRMLNRPR